MIRRSISLPQTGTIQGTHGQDAGLYTITQSATRTPPQQPPPRQMDKKNQIALISLAVGILALLLVILLPMSFSYIEYYEYGLKRQKSTGEVAVDIVHTEGRYTYGPDFDFLVYKADAHFLELNTIDVFTHDKLEVQVTARLQYFLRKDEIPLLHKQFNVYYKEVVKTSAVDALKGAIPIYSTRELINNRTSVEKDLYEAVRQRLGGVCCRPDCGQYAAACPVGCKPRETCSDGDKGLYVDVLYFQLGGVYIPDSIKVRFVEALLLQEKNVRSQLIQEAKVIRKDTSATVAMIKNDARELTQNATAQGNLIRNIGYADKKRITEKARIIGLHKLFTNLNITDKEYKTSYDYLRSLMDNPKVHLTVDFNQRIAGTL